MPKETTYSGSFFENEIPKKEKAIIPKSSSLLPQGTKFDNKTSYNQSYLPVNSKPVAPIIPNSNISTSKNKMLCDTTNKVLK